MLTLLLLSTLAAPRFPVQEEAVLYVPRLDAMTTLTPFFEAAGVHSRMLRPQSWGADAHPLITANLLDAGALAQSGIDGSQALTRFTFGEAAVSCVTVKDVTRYRAACDEKLQRMGEVFEKKVGGLAVRGSTDALGRVLVAYAMKGNESCAVNGNGRSVDALLPDLVKVLNTAVPAQVLTQAAKVPGPLQVLLPKGNPQGVVSLDAAGHTLTASALFKNTKSPKASPGASALGAFTVDGALVLRTRVAKAEVGALAKSLARELPGTPTLSPLAEALTPYLTGAGAAVFSHAEVTKDGLRTKPLRFFAAKSALLVEVSDVAAVAAALEKVDASALRFNEGTLTVSLHGNVLVLANDAGVKSRAVAALAKSAGKHVHAADFELRPELAAQALRQVPLTEALRAPELVIFVAVATELGPLLTASQSINGWLDSGANLTGKLVWVLKDGAAPRE